MPNEELIASVAIDKPLEYSEVLKYWKRFVDGIQHSDPRMFSALNGQGPELDSTAQIIKIAFRNHALVDEFKANFKSRVLSYLRSHLENQSMELEEQVLDADVAPRTKFYTDTDKLKHMIEKNPALLKLRQDLNLDLD